MHGYWIKLHHQVLDDHRVGLLPDGAKWRYIACLLMAGEANDDGFLPEMDAMLFRLRPISEAELEGDLTLMARRGLVELRVHPDGSERWYISDYADTQRAMTDKERVQRFRSAEHKPRNADVTKRYTDKDKDKEREGEEKQNGRVRVVSGPVNRDVAPPPSPLPPGVTREQEDARAPKAAKRELTADEKRVAGVMNAISDVTGVSAKLNFGTVQAQAQALDEAGYTADQLQTHYSRRAVPGLWNWYTDDWRGRKGDLPTYRNISDTIAAAVATNKVKQQVQRVDPFMALLEESERKQGLR